jgi:hypothetical protein
MNNQIFILPTSCIRFGHFESNFCLPKKSICDNTVIDGILAVCGEQWNCNTICTGDIKYFMPVPEDGKFMIQTNFNNSDAGGWGDWIFLALLDSNGDVIEDIEHTDIASRYIAAKNDKYKYQTIEIDVANIDIDCFGIKIYTADQEVCTQFYKKENCNNLVTLEGLVSKFDCWNNYYGDPVGEYVGDNFRYSNKIYIDGSIKYYGGNVDVEDGAIKEYTRFHPSKKIPGFMMKYIINKILASKKVKMNDVEYINDGSGNFSVLPKSTMFFPMLEFYTECTGGQSGGCE